MACFPLPYSTMYVTLYRRRCAMRHVIGFLLSWVYNQQTQKYPRHWLANHQTSNSGKKEEAAVQNNLSPVIMNYCLDHSYHMDADVNVTWPQGRLDHTCVCSVSKQRQTKEGTDAWEHLIPLLLVGTTTTLRSCSRTSFRSVQWK